MSGYSVIIPSRKRPAMLREAVASVLGQSMFPAHIFVIIDEPTGDTDYGFATAWPECVEVTFTGGGLGAAATRNIGLRRAQTDFVFFLDDDDIWYPHKARRQIDLLRERPDCVGVTCWREIEYPGGTRIEKVRERDLNHNIRTINYTGSFSFFGFRRHGGACACYLDEGLVAAQDHEYYIRMASFGKTAVVPEVLARYRAHQGNRITNDQFKKATALAYIHRKHQSHMTLPERTWNAGRLRALHASLCPGPGKALWQLLQAGAILLGSRRSSLLLPQLLWRSWKQRVR